ncbi:MAG: hypothetical protein AB4040_03605 [Synechococcus sp.]
MPVVCPIGSAYRWLSRYLRIVLTGLTRQDSAWGGESARLQSDRDRRFPDSAIAGHTFQSP